MKILPCLCYFLCAAVFCFPSVVFSSEYPYLIGQGRYDITGPAAETGMVGYGNLNQQTSGIHTRQFSRSFIVVDPDSGQRVVFVSSDLAFVTDAIRQEVVARLQKMFGDIYTLDNVFMSATHTHSGPGGYSHYVLYNLTSLGFSEQNFEAIVAGTVKAITKAHENLVPGRIVINQGEIEGAGVNRSLQAYELNPETERMRYESTVNKNMVLLRFVSQEKDLGVLNWFGVHSVSMTQNNLLISGDNKGVAALMFERWKNDPEFVAAFLQSESGDISPNLNGDGTGPTDNEFDNSEIIGERQFSGAQELYMTSKEILKGPIRAKHQFIDMHNMKVDAKFTGNKEQYTCVGSLGYAFAAGAEDGPGPSFFKEGMLVGNPFIDAVAHSLLQVDAELKACQAPKPILLATGNGEPHPWTPNILPVGIVTIGELAIVSLPAEVTTMAARRIKETVLEVLEEEVKHVVISTLVNQYSGYVTTYEEYQSQQYEGGHTLFGPWTLAAYQQSLYQLAKALREGEVVDSVSPPVLASAQFNFQPGVVHDTAPSGKKMGDVESDVASSYKAGDVVHASFWSGHPKNDLRTGAGYCTVEYRMEDSWVEVVNDMVLETQYRWQRINGLSGTSLAHCTWSVPLDALPGDYRILHNASYKEIFSRNILPLSGTSSVFSIQ